MTCTNPVLIAPKGLPKRFGPKLEFGMYVPCGKCISCRIARTREWTTRILHESSMYEDNCFVTLTYNDENLPENGSLSKRALQLFIKRLRFELGDRRIKYYACGEYGDSTNRPHYHMCILNWNPFTDKSSNSNSKKTGNYKSSDKVSMLWPYGFNVIGSLTADSIRYVAQYVQKKYTGKLAEETYGDKEPPFQLCSLGMGKEYCLKNQDYFREKLGCTIHGKEVGLPRYYKKILEIPTEVLLEKSLEHEKKLLDHYHATDIYDGKLQIGLKKARAQADANIKAKINLKKRKL